MTNESERRMVNEDRHDERASKYAEALGWRRDIEHGAIRAMLDEQVQRVLAVADAEQAELRAALRLSQSLGSAARRDWSVALDRAEASEAESAKLAEKVARVEALADPAQARGFVMVTLDELRTALTGPEPEATEGGDDRG